MTQRNFAIIAHIDHGKSTLADRLLEATQTMSQREMQPQVLDSMELERLRGITIKSHPVTMHYTLGQTSYQLNLIDTPGHVDFSYEVSRALAACEGAILVVDATQGIQAQTLANLYMALERDLTIIPVLNKIDLPSADCEGVAAQIEELIGIDRQEILHVSAKTGEGITPLLEAIITRIPPPPVLEEKRSCALVFDSHYDSYRGVLVYIRVMSGQFEKGQLVTFCQNRAHYTLQQTAQFTPKEVRVSQLRAGDVGCVVLGIKNPKEVRVGDTLTDAKHSVEKPLPGFQAMQPVVFAAIYPLESTDYQALSDALAKLQLNDAALFIEAESSKALGLGFRCGFLGLLHLEIVFERVRRDFGLEVITTAPGVRYKYKRTNGEEGECDQAGHYPDPVQIDQSFEPWVRSRIITPSSTLGAVLSLANDKRGQLQKTETLDETRLLLHYDFPLSEIVTDFSDKLKSVTQGFASFDYTMDGYRSAPIVKLEMKVHNEPIEELAQLVHRDRAEARGRWMCQKLKETMQRQQFKVAIQAAIGGKIIARETLSELKKDVTAKCYGGDISRKRKLWEAQAKGKKKMKERGRVHLGQDAYMALLRDQD